MLNVEEKRKIIIKRNHLIEFKREERRKCYKAKSKKEEKNLMRKQQQNEQKKKNQIKILDCQFLLVRSDTGGHTNCDKYIHEHNVIL